MIQFCRRSSTTAKVNTEGNNVIGWYLNFDKFKNMAITDTKVTTTFEDKSVLTINIHQANNAD